MKLTEREIESKKNWSSKLGRIIFGADKLETIKERLKVLGREIRKAKTERDRSEYLYEGLSRKIKTLMHENKYKRFKVTNFTGLRVKYVRKQLNQKTGKKLHTMLEKEHGKDVADALITKEVETITTYKINAKAFQELPEDVKEKIHDKIHEPRLNVVSTEKAFKKSIEE